MDLVNLVDGFSGFSEFRVWIWWIQVMDLLDLLDLIVNCMKICFLPKSAPNRSPRPLNTQFWVEISIRTQWNTSRGPQKNR